MATTCKNCGHTREQHRQVQVLATFGPENIPEEGLFVCDGGVTPEPGVYNRPCMCAQFVEQEGSDGECS